MSRVVESVAESLLDVIGKFSDASMPSIQRAENGTVIVKCRPNPIETVYGEERVSERTIQLMGHAVSKAAYQSLDADNFQWAIQTNTMSRAPTHSPKVGEEVMFVGNAKVGGSILDPILQFDVWVMRDEERFLLATGTSSIVIQRHDQVENVPEVVSAAHADDVAAEEPKLSSDDEDDDIAGTSSDSPQPKKKRTKFE